MTAGVWKTVTRFGLNWDISSLTWLTNSDMIGGILEHMFYTRPEGDGLCPSSSPYGAKNDG